jgi:phage baseplate assembly protein W
MAREVFINREPDYRDLDLDFFKNPSTDDIIMKEGAEAIKRSVRNIIFYNFYEKPFQPYFGSGVRNLLFENVTPITAFELRDAIENVLKNFEPRVSVKQVIVNDDSDRNGYEVRLEYIILNRDLPMVSTLFLERIR